MMNFFDFVLRTGLLRSRCSLAMTCAEQGRFANTSFPSSLRGLRSRTKQPSKNYRHCEEQSDETTQAQPCNDLLGCFVLLRKLALLAMTGVESPIPNIYLIRN